MSDLTAELRAPESAATMKSIVPSAELEIQALYGYPQPIPPAGLLLKRCLDLLIAVPAVVFLAPLFAAISILIKLDSRGPVLYRSARVGFRGAIFDCLKFRSMICNADELKEKLRTKNERKGPTFKIAEDPRITRLGSFLRKYSLDELPQLLNVLTGDMSIVGPRPHPLDDVARYEPRHLQRCSVRPGLTGLWQVQARRDPSFEVNMKLDMEYIQNWTFWFDLKLICQTFAVVLRGDGQ